MQLHNRSPSSKNVYKWVAILLAILAVVSVVLGPWLFDLYSRYKRHRNEISDVNGLIMSDLACRREFKKMQIPDLVDYFQYIHHLDTNYEDPRLDVIVNDEKNRMISDIIKELRQRASNSLGGNPEAWIKEYGYDLTNANLKVAAPEK